MAMGEIIAFSPKDLPTTQEVLEAGSRTFESASRIFSRVKSHITPKTDPDIFDLVITPGRSEPSVEHVKRLASDSRRDFSLAEKIFQALANNNADPSLVDFDHCMLVPPDRRIDHLNTFDGPQMEIRYQFIKGETKAELKLYLRMPNGMPQFPKDEKIYFFVNANSPINGTWLRNVHFRLALVIGTGIVFEDFYVGTNRRRPSLVLFQEGENEVFCREIEQSLITDVSIALRYTQGYMGRIKQLF